MRTAPLPQPNVNLADDPDPAAELGQRLAASAQTSQGIITNYLFYGQRRAAEGQTDDRHSLGLVRQAAEAADAERQDAARQRDEEHDTVRGQLEEGPESSLPGSEPVTHAQAEGARLAFHVVPGIVDERGSEPTDPIGGDYLAIDGLVMEAGGKDPLATDDDPVRMTTVPNGLIQH